MDPVANLDDLIWAFDGGVEYADDEDAESASKLWPYGSVLFTLSRGQREVVLDLSPGYDLAHLRVSDGDGEVVNLMLREVRSVELHREKDSYSLRFGYSLEAGIDMLVLHLHPTISLNWEPLPFRL